MLRSRYKKPPEHFRGPLVTNTGLLRTHLKGVLKSFNDAHPEWRIPPDLRWKSLLKRIEGTIKVHFQATIIDRNILDWLEQHREEWPELCKLRGGLRKVIPEEMERRGDI